jgi:hypothetical protein
VSSKEYLNYIEACKQAGFTIDAEKDSTSYTAYNSDGYYVRITQYSYSETEMEIEVTPPISMGTITWPSNKIAKKIPTPKSTTGRIESTSSSSMTVYIGDTSKDDYNEYVSSCMSAGYTEDCSRSDTRFSAYNSSKYHIIVEYKGNNIMYIYVSK